MLTLSEPFVQRETRAEAGLLELAQAGNAEAFGELCRAHEAGLVRHAMTLCRNATLAEELAQDTFIEAWKSLHRYNGLCRLFTWLCAILLNRYRNFLRQKHPLPLSSLAVEDRRQCEDHLEQLSAESFSPDKAAQSEEESGIVLECVNALPAKYQQVIYLRFYVDNSLESIASALNCSVGTVKSRLFRALAKLRGMKSLQRSDNSDEPKALQYETVL